MGDQSIRQALEHLSKLIRDIPVAMLTTSLPDHTLRSRPMVNINQKVDGDLWFFTHKDDPKAEEIVGNPKVNIGFASPSEGNYVSVSGSASLVQDKKRNELLWTDGCQKWFPEGPSDPKLALLKIELERAEYWDEKSGAMVAVAGVVKSAVGAEHPTPMEHEKIDWEDQAGIPTD